MKLYLTFVLTLVASLLLTIGLASCSLNAVGPCNASAYLVPHQGLIRGSVISTCTEQPVIYTQHLTLSGRRKGATYGQQLQATKSSDIPSGDGTPLRILIFSSCFVGTFTLVVTLEAKGSAQSDSPQDATIKITRTISREGQCLNP